MVNVVLPEFQPKYEPLFALLLVQWIVKPSVVVQEFVPVELPGLQVAGDDAFMLYVTVVVSAQPTEKASRAVKKKVSNFFIT